MTAGDGTDGRAGCVGLSQRRGQLQRCRSPIGAHWALSSHGDVTI
jgi:hypothetical protein